jgi:hypothetical protein
MLNAPKTQLTLPIPPASHLLLFVVALCMAAVLAFVQNRQVTKPQHNNVFKTSLENRTAQVSYHQTESNFLKLTH